MKEYKINNINENNIDKEFEEFNKHFEDFDIEDDDEDDIKEINFKKKESKSKDINRKNILAELIKNKKKEIFKDKNTKEKEKEENQQYNNKTINNTNDFNSFLDGTSCGYFLQQLNLKMDVINFYKIIMVNLVSTLENMSSSKKINFNVKQIQEDFIKMKEIMEEKFAKTGEKTNIVDNDFFRSNFLSDFEKELAKETNDDTLNDRIKSSKRKELFNTYIPDVTKDEIEKKI